MIGLFQQKLKRAFFRWSLRRSPRQRELILSQKRIYIMPSRAGFTFLVMLLVMLVLGINFQNNLIFAVTFLLGSLFVVAILHTYANLSGMRIQFVRGHPCFAGEQAGFDLCFSSKQQRDYESIQLRWQHGTSSSFDLAANQTRELRLYQPTQQRGIHKAEALLIETFYPLGLFRAWTWMEADLSTLVYPRPIEGGQLPGSSVSHSGKQASEQTGGEDFSGLEQFQTGMSLKRVAWKQYARGQGLHVKYYVELTDNQCWLCWEFWPELDVEARLSRLTWWVLQLDRKGQPYGLRMPGVEIEPQRGETHRLNVLEALACFEQQGGL